MISLHEPRFTLEDEDIVLEALRSTWVSTGGPFVEQFERDFAAYVGSKHAVSLSNGTVALQLGIEVLKRLKRIERSFDVLVPTLSFIATSNAVSHANGTPVLVDCAPNSLNIDPEAVRRTIDLNYRQDALGWWIHKSSGNVLLCLMPAHIMGWCCDMAKLRKLAQEYKLPVIDDAAEALGCRYLDGSHLGKGSFASVFSFNGNKILTTGGGGMLVTDDDEFAQLAKHLSTTAKTDGLRYEHDQVGYNFRMVNILAALGVSQLKRMPATLQKKTATALSYDVHFKNTDIQIFAEPHCLTNNWIVNALFPSEASRELALKHLIQSKIQARPLWTPAHRLPFMTVQNTLGGSFLNADSMWRRMLSLPSSAHITSDEIRQVVQGIKDSL
ncbi:MAG: aminotransferase class I/II-fold pyridoxal phosphate-dependent enzyme [Proteobacteria bacterium]|nr:aminotransferase class I/II-fold pyridoxal phosphate-dependent enzyme [Pseudomonadota bacterium]